MIKTIAVAYAESKAKYIVLLFRPVDHIFFTIPLVIIGYACGIRIEHSSVNITTLIVLIVANILAISFAFAINEIEDAEDDKKDPNRKNPVAKGNLTRKQALTSTFLAFAISLSAFSIINRQVMITGAIMLIISFFYSYKGVRLKSLPVIDLVSHSLMLSTLIALSGYLAVSNRISLATPVFLACFLGSIYGQLYNQIRDYTEDKKAKLNNTTQILKLNRTKQLATWVLIITILFIVYSFYLHLFPIFLLPSILLAAPIIAIAERKISKERLKKMRLITGYISGWILLNMFSIAFLISLI